MSVNNGGPAFPAQIGGSDNAQIGFEGEVIQPGMRAQYSGMTLRDYFAAKAMPALLSVMVSPIPEDVAMWAYKHADAMLAERAK